MAEPDRAIAGAEERDVEDGEAVKAPAPIAVLEGSGVPVPKWPPRWASKPVAPKAPIVMVNSKARCRLCILSPLPRLTSFLLMTFTLM
jgi:hypothetical protein